MNSEPISDNWRQAYLNRPIAKLPGDLVKACDQIRAQGREINSLRSELWQANLKKGIAMGFVGAMAMKGIEVAVVALIKLLAR